MASDDDTEDEGFTVNEQFASKYEHEKARDEVAWRRRQGLDDPPAGSDEEESSTDDEGGRLLTKGLDRQITRTSQMIKSKDPKIYDAGAQLYVSESESEENSSSGSDSSSDDDIGAQQQRQPVTIKDLVRQRTLAKMDRVLNSDASDSDAEEPTGGDSSSRTYVQEQAELKRATRAAVAAGGGTAAGHDDGESDADSGDDMFTVKVKSAEEEAELEAIMEDSYAKGQASDAARAEAGDRILAQRQQRTREQQQVGLDEEMEPQTELGEQMFPSPAPAKTA
jgi:protein KRI1